LKERKARSCANPDDDRQTGEGKAPQFPSIVNSMEKDIFHTVLSAPVWHALSAAQAGPQLRAGSVHQLGESGG